MRPFFVRARSRVVLAPLALLVAAGVVACELSVLTPQPASALPVTSTASAGSSAAALSGADFNAGLIISDELFYMDNAMSQAQIQSFLNTRIGACQNSNCLNVVRTNTFTRAADRNICAPYSGAANETAAAIIYKVQQACGISAKVLLVTLQKEQSLVTHTAPTLGRLGAAMGYACPDTAPCDAEFFGLYNQVYKAAWQLKRYSTPDRWGRYQPGLNSIQYHPNVACGSKPVNILNNATAALYNYTPYTPNDAALSNLTGATPPCGSYGNRNFWVFYNSWFGSTVVGAGNAEISAAYSAAGGASGPLGAVVNSTDCGFATSCTRTYANGIIAWTPLTGAHAVHGTFWGKLRNAGGVAGSIGYPAGSAVPITGPNGDGQSQAFTKAQIVTSSAGTFILRDAIRTKHAELLWVRGELGWPTSDQSCTASTKCAQRFQGGAIASSGPATYVSNGVIGAKYLAAGGPTGSLGHASGAIVPISSPNGDGTSQAFANGQIVSSAAGTFILTNPNLAAHAQLLWVRGTLGWPTGDAVCASGSCTQQFGGGTITSTGSTAYATSSVIATAFAAAGGPSGPIGPPIGSTVAIVGPNGDGWSQAFQNAQIVSSASGTFVLSGEIRAEHARLLWVRGSLGWPTSNAVCADSACQQSFQHGLVTVRNGVAHATYGEVAARFGGAGGVAGTLGYPIGDVVPITGPNGDGQSQAFDNGQIVSSFSGTFILSGAIRTKHAELLWVRGALGWPTADAVCTGTTCSQTFQGGAVTSTPSGATVSY